MFNYIIKVTFKWHLLIMSSNPHPHSSAPATTSFNAVFNKPSGTNDSIIFLKASARKHVNNTKPVDIAIQGTRAMFRAILEMHISNEVTQRWYLIILYL